MYRPPTGASVRYQTKRHWHEIVAECADALFWSSAIVLFAIGASIAFDFPRAMWLLILCLYSVGHLGVEIAKWEHEVYYIIDLPNGSTRIVKTSGIIRQRPVMDDVGAFGRGRTEESGPFARFLGFRKVTLASPTRTYLTGQRIPVQFLEELDKITTRPKPPQTDNERELVISLFGDWVRDGILDPVAATVAARRFLWDNM